MSTETLIHNRSNVNAQGQDLSRWGAVLVCGQDRELDEMSSARAPLPIGNGSILDEHALVNPTVE